MDQMIPGGADPSAADGTSALVTETTMQTFGKDVVEASMSRPVLVDFWADWCGPCKQLMPALEAAVKAANGAIGLAKVNADQNQELCGQLRIQSLPTVMAFWQGQPVDAFQGAVPPSQLKAFVDKQVALAGGAGTGSDPVTAALEQADELLASGEHMQAAQIYQQILGHAPGHGGALVGMAEAALKLDEVDQTREIMAMLDDEAREDPKLKERISRLEINMDLLKQAESAGDIAPLLAAIEADPLDYQARYDLSLAHQASGDMDAAAESLLAIIMRDREWNEDAARQQLLKLFEAAGHTDPFTLKYRRRLSSVLFS